MARAPDPLDDAHRRPEGVDDATVEAVGVVSEALEWLERARGRLYDFHQMVGHLDLKMGEAAEQLRRCGYEDVASLLECEVVGRNVLDGRWTFQVIEEFDDLYDEPIRAAERRVAGPLLRARWELPRRSARYPSWVVASTRWERPSSTTTTAASPSTSPR